MNNRPQAPPVAGHGSIREPLKLHLMLAAFAIDALIVLAAISLIIVVSPPPGGVESGSGGVVTITPGDVGQLTTADAEAVVRSVPGVTLLSRIVFGTAAERSSSQAPPLSVEAVDPSYALIPGISLASGSFFTVQDAVAANRVAVLGAEASRGLFAGAQSPLGQTIRLADVPFTVVGVLASQTNSGGTDASGSAVLIPFQSGQVRLFGTRPLGEIVLQAADASQTQTIVQQVQRLLRTRHPVPAGQRDGFTIISGSDSGTSASRPGAAFSARFQSLARQYACRAKGMCLQ